MLAAIENAMITQIKTAVPYLRAVDSYGGQFDDETFDVIRALPAVWVTFAGSAKPEQTGPKRFLTPATFAVMCAARSVRSERTTRHDGPAAGEIGAYRILSDVRLALLMQDLGMDIDHFRPGAVRTLYNTKLRASGLAVFAQEWHTKYVDQAMPDPDIPVDRIDLLYSLKPGDDRPDAEDLVKLP